MFFLILSNDFEDDPLVKILSWRDPLQNQEQPSPDSFKLLEVKSIVEDDQDKWGTNFQGILIDVDWDSLSFD